MYVTFPTTRSLLISYESIAIDYKKDHFMEYRERDDTLTGDAHVPNPIVNLRHGPALLALNASIVEGVARYFLTECIRFDLGAKMDVDGVVPDTFETRALQDLVATSEGSGGWAKLLEAYTRYFGSPLRVYCDEEAFKAVGHLFTLRNVISHGTVLTQSKPGYVGSNDASIDRWDRTMQSTRDYLVQAFGGSGLFEALQHHDIPEHFFKAGQSILNSLLSLDARSERAADLVKYICGYSFGYRYGL